MVKFELKRHELIEKPYELHFQGGGILYGESTYQLSLDTDYILGTMDLVANPSFINTTIMLGTDIVPTRPNTTYTENLEVNGEVRQHGGIRYNDNNFEMWDSTTGLWVRLGDTLIGHPKKNIFRRIYDSIRRFRF
jgi:hypothetical protein